MTQVHRSFYKTSTKDGDKNQSKELGKKKERMSPPATALRHSFSKNRTAITEKYSVAGSTSFTTIKRIPVAELECTRERIMHKIRKIMHSLWHSA